MRPTDSPFLKGLMRTKECFFRRVKFLIGNGMSTRFGEDTWLGETPLAIQYPTLYNIVQCKEDYVSTVFQTTPLNIQFRRSLVGEGWNRWLHLVCRLMVIKSSDEPDTQHWRLLVLGAFLAKSMYIDMISIGPIPHSLHIRKIKVPLKNVDRP